MVITASLTIHLQYQYKSFYKHQWLDFLMGKKKLMMHKVSSNFVHMKRHGSSGIEVTRARYLVQFCVEISWLQTKRPVCCFTETTLSTSGPSSYHPVLIYKKGQSAAPASGGSLTKSNFLHILNSRKFLFLLYQ